MKTYTFHVSLPGFGRVWRKLELPSDFTLEDLHLAIQYAFDFDNDHLYSFFMSGKAWDADTEYALPDGADPWGTILDMDADEGAEDAEDADEADDADDADDELFVDENGMALPDPTAGQLSEMFQALKADPALLEEARKQVTEQLGIPAFLFDLVVNNPDQVIGMMGDAGALGGMSSDIFNLSPASGDVRETSLESLDLTLGKTFLYLFDYGDDWRFKVRVSGINSAADPNAEYPAVVEAVGDAPPQYPDWDEDDEEGYGADEDDEVKDAE